MTTQPDHPREHQDGSTEPRQAPVSAPSEAPPPEALQGYPPEAAPATDDGTVPVAVPGEQTDPDRRLDVFPEDEQASGPTR